MAHWAELDENNIVLRVTVGNNNDTDEGYQWLVDNFGGTWVKTSYNTDGGKHSLGGTPFRKNYAGIGYTYDPHRDAFFEPKPLGFQESDSFRGLIWKLNDDTCKWEVFPAYPIDDKEYSWNEATTSWIEII